MTEQREVQKLAGNSRISASERELRKRFGEKIQELRLQLGYSQEELCSRAGLNRTYLSDIERGEGNATLSVLNRLAGALDIDLSQLFCGISASSKRSAHILLAGSPAMQERLHETLAGHQLVGCQQIKEAKRALEEGEFGVVICSIDFSQGKLFELLRYLRAHERYADVPFLCIDSVPSQYVTTATLSEAMDIALRALGATAFVQLDTDQPRCDWQLRQEIEQLLTPSN